MTPGLLPRDGFYIGEVAVYHCKAGFVLTHRDDQRTDQLAVYTKPDDAAEIARYDDEENYRPLKTAPNLRHGWRMEVQDLSALIRALDCFYPGRLAVFAAWRENRLSVTPLRETLNRQSGMYRVAARISDEQIDDVVGNFCRSNGGCLRTILWKRDEKGTIASAKLPQEKFNAELDQTGVTGGPRSATAATAATIPLLCQEACNLLVAECRKVVVAGRDVSPKRP